MAAGDQFLFGGTNRLSGSPLLTHSETSSHT
jgi:hypothetical protein